MDITGPEQVQAIIADPRFVPPPPDPPGPVGTMTWLRASVARFSSGETHARRRALVEAELARLDPGVLRTLATQSTVDSRGVPVAVLARQLGVQDVTAAVAAVRKVALAYQGVYEAAPDNAVAELVSMLEPADSELVANRIGLLVQACDATAALISSPDEPPVRFTRRQALVDVVLGDVTVPAGTVVRLDISAFPFGGDARPCPGREHALALAEGARK
jgi:hypothetical protein